MSTMSRICASTVFLFVTIAFSGNFAAAAQFETGRSLAPAMQAYESLNSGDEGANESEAARYSGYITASYDALIALGMICDNGATRQDVVTGVSGFINANPGMADSPAFELTYLSLIASYPCPEGSGGFKQAHAPGNIEDGHSLAPLAAEHVKSVSDEDSDSADLIKAASFTGYVSGAHDALSLARIVCTTFGSAQKLSDLVATYIQANPGKWDDPGFSLITDTFIEGGHLCQR